MYAYRSLNEFRTCSWNLGSALGHRKAVKTVLWVGLGRKSSTQNENVTHHVLVVRFPAALIFLNEGSEMTV